MHPIFLNRPSSGIGSMSQGLIFSRSLLSHLINQQKELWEITHISDLRLIKSDTSLSKEHPICGKDCCYIVLMYATPGAITNLQTYTRTSLHSIETGCLDTQAAEALGPPQSQTTRRRQWCCGTSYLRKTKWKSRTASTTVNRVNITSNWTSGWLTWLPVVLFSLVVKLLQYQEIYDIRHVMVPWGGGGGSRITFHRHLTYHGISLM